MHTYLTVATANGVVAPDSAVASLIATILIVFVVGLIGHKLFDDDTKFDDILWIVSIVFGFGGFLVNIPLFREIGGILRSVIREVASWFNEEFSTGTTLDVIYTVLLVAAIIWLVVLIVKRRKREGEAGRTGGLVVLLILLMTSFLSSGFGGEMVDLYQSFALWVWNGAVGGLNRFV